MVADNIETIKTVVTALSALSTFLMILWLNSRCKVSDLKDKLERAERRLEMHDDMISRAENVAEWCQTNLVAYDTARYIISGNDFDTSGFAEVGSVYSFRNYLKNKYRVVFNDKEKPVDAKNKKGK